MTMVTKKTVFIIVPGIESDPDNQRGWTDEFATELNIRTPEWVQAEKFEYFAKWYSRWWKQEQRAKDLMRRVNRYLNADYRAVLIGHSNGCDLIGLVLDMGVRVDAVHLFAAATKEKYFEAAIASRQVRRVHLYGSSTDDALRVAKATGGLLSLVGKGYGSLGLRGPEFAAKYPGIVEDHGIPGYRHSTWFAPGHLDATIELLMMNEQADRLSSETMVAPAITMPPEEPPTTKLP